MSNHCRSQGLDKAELPLGKIFSTFMVSIMLGSLIFKSRIRSAGAGDILLWTGLSLLGSNLNLALTADGTAHCPFIRHLAFTAFIVLELSLGLYFPAMASLRSVYIPESHR